MKIVQVISGHLPLDPTENRRWGAMETVMIEYQKKLTDLGHEVSFKYLNDVVVGEQDIVHLHVANLCIEAQKKGIPYIYSNHDHTSCYLGRDSDLYRQQLAAIKGSIFSICHAESVLDFFNGTDKLFYVPHGVDTKFYIPLDNYVPPTQIEDCKLLMCANNGMAGDYTIDRKGFRLGIEAAKTLGMEITIVGAESNAKFFEHHKDLAAYENLILDISNPPDSKKLSYFMYADIFIHASSIEFGSPNLSICESASCCLPMVASYSGSMYIEGLHQLKELTVEDVIEKIKAAYNYLKYDSGRSKMLEARHLYDWGHVATNIESMYHAILQPKNLNSKQVKKQYLEVYGV